MRRDDDDWSRPVKYVIDASGCWKIAACLLVAAGAVLAGVSAAGMAILTRLN